MAAGKKAGLAVTLLCGWMLAGCGGAAKGPATPDAKTEPKAAPATGESKTPLVPKVEVADWCPEHGVSESVCTRCNASLVADFKAKGDWCEKHSLPNSQCLTCKPELKEEWEKRKPKAE